MPSYRYRAFTRPRDRARPVEAPTREEVIRRIEYLGFIPADAEPETKTLLERSGVSSSKLRAPVMSPSSCAARAARRSRIVPRAALLTLAEDAAKPLAPSSTPALGHLGRQSFTEVLERHPDIIEPAYAA
jgi:general secretion pathway protein F